MLNPTDRKARFAVAALLAAVYFLAGRLGSLLAFVHPSATAVWPPTGIALAALLLLGYRVWPGILVGAFLVNLTTAGSVASSLGIAAGNTLEGLVAARLVNTFAHSRRAFERLQDVVTFAALAALASTTVSATIGVTSLALTGSARWADVGPIWLTWWLGDAGGALVVAPLLVLWGTYPPRPGSRRRAPEVAALLLAVVLIGLAVFAGLHPLPVKDYPFEFLAFPVLVWAAFRFGPRETATALCLLAGLAIWGTLRGLGPFAGATPNEALLLQAFLGVAAVMSLGLAAAVLERQRAEATIQAERDRLRAEVAACEHAAEALREREQLLQDLVRRLIAAQEEERRRLAYEVHDGMAQTAAGAHLHLRAYARRYRPDQPEAREDLERALELAQRTVREARTVVGALRPTALDDLGLEPALRAEVEELRKEGLRVELEAALGPERLAPAVETALFRVAQEALTNARKHAQTTRARVVLWRHGPRVRLEIQDWGRGFDPAAMPADGGPGERLGLSGMRERVALLGGRCEVRSRPGAGTRVVAEVPLRPTAEPADADATAGS